MDLWVLLKNKDIVYMVYYVNGIVNLYIDKEKNCFRYV